MSADPERVRVAGLDKLDATPPQAEYEWAWNDKNEFLCS
jgi:hypothetical protein